MFLHLVLICPQLRKQKTALMLLLLLLLLLLFITAFAKKKLHFIKELSSDQTPPAWAALALLSTSSIIISSGKYHVPFMQSKHHKRLLQENSSKKPDSKIKLFTLHCLSIAYLSFQKANSEWHCPCGKTAAKNCLAQAQSSCMAEGIMLTGKWSSHKDFAAQSLTA